MLASPTISGTNQQQIRVYEGDSIQSESGSEAMESDEDNDDEIEDISERYQRNLQFFDEALPTWTVQNQQMTPLIGGAEGVTYQHILSPTASKLNHHLLNPALYRRIKKIESLTQLAEILQTPDNWEAQYLLIKDSPPLCTYLNYFLTAPSQTLELQLQSIFSSLMTCVAILLSISVVKIECAARIVVGGLLVRNEYDLKSHPDPVYIRQDECALLATEMKRDSCLNSDRWWHHGSRGVQVLSALYAYNAPTLLLSQSCWKLFVENGSRTQILSFPSEPDSDDPIISMIGQNTFYEVGYGRTFLKMLVICLLSERSQVPEDSHDRSTTTETITIPSTFKTPLGKDIPKKNAETMQKKHQSERFKNLKTSRKTKTPMFLSGPNESDLIYSPIRVYSQEDVLEDYSKREIQSEESDVFDDDTDCE